MVGEAYIHQPGQVKPGAVDAFNNHYTILLQEIRVMGKIKMRAVCTKVDTKVNTLFIVIRQINTIS